MKILGSIDIFKRLRLSWPLRSSYKVNRRRVLDQRQTDRYREEMARSTGKDAQALFHSLRSAYAATPTTLKVGPHKPFALLFYHSNENSLH